MKAFFVILISVLFVKPCFASEDDTLSKGEYSRFLAFPFLLRSPETDWGFGAAGAYFFKAKKGQEDLRTSDINLLGLYTLREQIVIVLGSTVYFPEENQIFRFHSSYSTYPDKFWGLGNESPDEAKEDYSLKQFFINPQLILRVFKKMYIGASFEMQRITDFEYISGGVFDEQDITGNEEGLSSGAGVLFTWDTRNNAFSPSKGSFVELNVSHFSESIGSDYKFTSMILDTRKFFSTGRKSVVGLQAYTKLNNGETPVRYLSMLGGTEIMRGYYKGRYTDQNLFALQAEYRQYLFWRLGVAGFVSAGQVSQQVNDFGMNDFHYAAGGGLRIMLKEKEKLNLRIDFGFGENSNGLYVILKEAF
jgi:outer membrane protein assembly factor BamA